MAIEHVYDDPQLGGIVFRKRKGVRRLSIRVHPLKGISVTVPYLVPFSAAVAFFRLKREWALRTVSVQKQRYENMPKAGEGQIEAWRKQAKMELPERLGVLAARYGFVYNKVTIKHNATNWGSCSVRGNINLNLNIVRLPEVLRDYILLHELCHLKHHDHGHAFHLLLEHVCTDNLVKLSDAGDEQAKALMRSAALSKARYPLDHVLSKAIKQYPIF